MVVGPGLAVECCVGPDVAARGGEVVLETVEEDFVPDVVPVALAALLGAGDATAAEGDGAVWTMAAQEAGFEGAAATSFGFSGTTGALMEDAEVAVDALGGSTRVLSVETGAAESVLFGERLLDF